MSLRDAVAFEQGADEGLLTLAASPPTAERDAPPGACGLDIRQSAALTVADAYLGMPGELSEGQWSHLVATLSSVEIAELALHLTKFSRNKVRVSLGLDREEIELEFYRPVLLSTDRDGPPGELP